MVIMRQSTNGRSLVPFLLAGSTSPVVQLHPRGPQTPPWQILPKTNGDSGMPHKLYVYGTLRPGNKPTHWIKGRIYDLGWFPGLVLDQPGLVACECIEVEDLTSFDKYEGYFEDDLSSSLYIRRPYLDGWVYEYNQEFDINSFIPCGDWLQHKERIRNHAA